MSGSGMTQIVRTDLHETSLKWSGGPSSVSTGENFRFTNRRDAGLPDGLARSGLGLKPGRGLAKTVLFTLAPALDATGRRCGRPVDGFGLEALDLLARQRQFVPLLDQPEMRVRFRTDKTHG